MILRMRSIIPTTATLLLLLLLGGSRCWAAEEGKVNATSPVGNKCPANTFHCPKENSCVPLDWLADGEPDCEDGADESDEARRVLAANEQQSKNGASTTAASTSTRSPATTESTTTSSTPSTPSTTSSEHIEISVDQSTESTRGSDSTSPPTNGSCSADTIKEMDRCAAEITAWLSEMGAVNFGLPSSSIFRNRQSLERIERGCKMLTEYASCMDGLPARCENNKGSQAFREWMTVQMYMCELLVPSIKEHMACFAAPRSIQQCPPIAVSGNRSSVMCSLLNVAIADINCVERQHGGECGEGAVELFSPMRSETEQVMSDLKCEKIQILVEKATITTSSTTEASSKEVEAAEDMAVTESRKVERVHPISTTTTTEASTTTDTEAPPSATDDLTNSLYALENVGHICQQTKPDQYSPIRVKICARKEELEAHAACFREVSLKTEAAKCQARPSKPVNTSCAATEKFNANVDCVIQMINDVCPVEVAEMVVDIQEKLNDEAIAHKCYQQSATGAVNAPINDDGFSLTPSNQRCSADQENAALVCLVELAEINRKLSDFKTLSASFLLEVSDKNSSFINNMCELYAKYEVCLDKSVFAQLGGRRCSFNSPLNTLARVGLAPICSSNSREILSASRTCLLEVARQTKANECQYGVENLGGMINLMLQGVHGEALLCKSYYLLREAFSCGERYIQDQCEPSVADDLARIQQEMNVLGVEEGCPVEQPRDLDAIIARPAQRPPPKAPTARTLPPPTQSAPNANPPPCEAEEQKRFSACVQPLTAFQPHPLAVIKQPKQIDEACEAYRAFNNCRATVKCNPLWAQGMSAMFDYACGVGYDRYMKVRQCVRKTTTRADIRECVISFSKGAPQEACQSSNRLLACSVPAVQEKCGREATDFVQEYVRRFASVIDPQCRVGEPPAPKAINTFNCTANEDQVVQHCSAPLNEIHSRLDELFEGGLQSFLKNVNSLAPVFAEGCNLTSEFRECARPVLQNNGSCVVSSCLMKAGAGICDQPDVSAAIEANLGCVFKQVSDLDFGKCLRSTIATLKHFNLDSPIVLKSCGEVPLNVLKALGSQTACPVSMVANVQPAKPSPIVPSAKAEPQCTEELYSAYDECKQSFYSKYDFTPAALVNQVVHVEELCDDVEKLHKCMEPNGICEPTAGKPRAIRKLFQRICSMRDAFGQRQDCLNKIVRTPKAAQCMEGFSSDEKSLDYCASLNQTTNCFAEEIFNECPSESVSFVYELTNEYLSVMAGKNSTACQLIAPNVALQTGCSEQDLVQHLECETMVDHFHFQPITFISNASRWDEFCEAVTSKYKPCMEKLPCRFEPMTTASLTLFENLCEHEVTRRDQRRFADCLSDFASTEQGKACLEPFTGIDMLARNAGARICTAVNSILSCSANEISQSCGDEALLHVYDIHSSWTHAFNASCLLLPPDLHTSVVTPKKQTVPPVDFSKDEQVESSTETMEISPSTIKTSTEQPDSEPTTMAGEDTPKLIIKPHPKAVVTTMDPSTTTDGHNKNVSTTTPKGSGSWRTQVSSWLHLASSMVVVLMLTNL